jgi:glycosyltransferase involved in cell wall biosynthesis
MNADTFAEWFRRQGYRVVRTPSSYWYEAGARAYQAFPYHRLIEPSEQELRGLLLKSNGAALRYSAPVTSARGKVSYHVVCQDLWYELLADHRDIHFVFVGDGAGREPLAAQVEERRLDNVQFLPFQPRARLPEVLATGDVSLVSLRQGIGSGSLPSKTFSILASGRPVLASVDEGSETWKLIDRAEAGLYVPSESPAQLADGISRLRQDDGLRQRLGQNGRLWAERYHSPQSATEHFEQLFLEVHNANQK